MMRTNATDASRRDRVFESVEAMVGDTPMVRLSRVDAIGPPEADDVPESRRAVIWAKFEAISPTASIEDRAAKAILDRAIADRRLAPGAIVAVPTSGDFGVAVARACVSRGHPCVVAMPSTMSLERRQLLEAFGAEVILTEPELQLEGALAAIDRVVADRPGAVRISPFDDAAIDAHRQTTAREIVEALRDRDVQKIAAFVATVGSGSTVSGVGEAFRGSKYSGFCDRVVAVEPAACATISRGARGPTKLQGMGVGFVPATYRASVVDEVRTVSDDDAWKIARALARNEGLLVGPSSGAAVAIALEIAREIGPGHHVATILADTGERYFSLASHFKHVAELPPLAADRA